MIKSDLFYFIYKFMSYCLIAVELCYQVRAPLIKSLIQCNYSVYMTVSTVLP